MTKQKHPEEESMEEGDSARRWDALARLLLSAQKPCVARTEELLR